MATKDTGTGSGGRRPTGRDAKPFIDRKEYRG